MPNLLAQMKPFVHGSCHAESTATTYKVFSYSTLIAQYDYMTDELEVSDTKYSTTTSRLQNIIRKSWGI